MRTAVFVLCALCAACGRDVGLATAPASHCPETAANKIAALADTSLIGRNLPTVTAYVCNGIVK